MKTFSETELLTYDGSNPALPIYLAIDQSVYDVSANPRMYGKVRTHYL
jgi:predicted heme/steroid binding protein